MKIILTTFICLFTAFQSANAGGIPGIFTLNLATQGKVIRVLDGDTIEVLQDKKPVRIRLANIDAPEKKQAFGSWSTSQLKILVAGKQVTVSYSQKDRYRRIIGRVFMTNGTEAPAASWFSLALHGYMNVTTQINHYQLSNGKRI